MKLITIFLLLIPLLAHARTGEYVLGIGQYRMSDRDSDAEARRIALERALQEAREKAGVFQVSATSRQMISEWGGKVRFDGFEEDRGVRSKVRLKIVSKEFAPVDQQVYASIRVGRRQVFIEDRVRYWACVVEAEVIEAEVEPVERPKVVAVAKPAEPVIPVSEPLPFTAAEPGLAPEYRIFKRGLECMLRGQWGPARSLFSHLLEKNPADGDARFLLAFCLEKMGDHGGFRQVLGQAVRRYPKKSIRGVLQASLGGEKVQGLML